MPPRVERIRGPWGEALITRLEFHLPERLSEDRNARAGGPIALPITVRAQLAPGVPRLDLTIELDNHSCDHRLQVLFPTGVMAEAGVWDAAFELLARPTQVPAGGPEWIEQPAAELPMRDFVAAHRSDSLLVAARGLREGRVNPEGTIAVTLLRCFGWLSRDDMATRKGGAGPQVETPGGQEIGPQRFELGLIPFPGDILAALPLAWSFQAGLRAEVTAIHSGRLPSSGSLLQVDSAGVKLSAVKEAEDGAGIVARVVNLTRAPAQATVTCHLRVRGAALVRMDEARLRDLVVVDGRRVTLTLGPCQVQTVRLAFDKR